MNEVKTRRNLSSLLPNGLKRSRLFSTQFQKRAIEEITTSSKRLFEEYDHSTSVNHRKHASYHQGNSQFLRCYQHFSGKSSQQRYLVKTFIDLIIQYKARGYIIPDLTTRHNLFSPSVLLLQNNEIEDYYKFSTYSTTPKQKDKSKLYLYKVERQVDNLKFKRIVHQEDMRTYATEADPGTDPVYQSTIENDQLKRKSIRKSLIHVDPLKEKKKLIADITSTNRAINAIEMKMKLEPLNSQKVVIPRLKLKQNNEDTAIKTIKTLTSFHSTNYSNRDYHSKRSNLSQTQSSLKKSKGFNESSQKKASRNKVNNWLSNAKTVVLMEKESDNGNESLDNERKDRNSLVTQKDYLQFFYTLRQDDIDLYDFERICKDYCFQFLTAAQRKEIDFVYKRGKEAKYLMYIINNIQSIVEKYDVNANYPRKQFNKPILAKVSALDKKIAMLDKRFGKNMLQTKLH